MSIYSLILAVGTALGLVWAATPLPPRQTARFVDSCLGVLAGALLGSRAAFVAAHWDYFRLHALEIPQVWQGGLSGPGALAGAALTSLLVAWLARQPLGALADAMLPLGACLAVSAWLGCWLEGSAYGQPVNAWWGIPARDEWGVLAPRLPVQLFGALLALGLAWLVERSRPRLSSGWASGLWLAGLALGNVGLSFLRADPIQTWRGLRLEAWGWLGLAAAILAGLLLSWLARRLQSLGRLRSPLASRRSQEGS